ncbi:T9SS type A sorting domain-containing protein [candidate division KSB1 bacterium]|nr:T9SS type A sorting domain-containing protein [candidate division KSB1 bacterium]
MKKLTFLLVVSTCFYGNLFGQAPDTSWTKTYGGEEREIGHAVCQTKDDGYIIAGITESFGAGGEDIFLVRTDTDGDTLWTKTFGGTESDWGYAVQQTDDDGYIIAGFTSTFGNGDNDVYLLKTDANGDTLWTKTYGGTEDDRALSVRQTSDNGYIVSGVTSSFGTGDYDLYLLKTDANGDTLWTKTYGGAERDAGYSVQITSDNGYIVTGYTSLSAVHRAVFLVKTDSDGDTLWTKIYGKEFLAVGASVKQTSDNGYIIAGTKVINNAVPDYNFYLIKTDANGDTLWTRDYGGEYVEWGSSCQQTSDGGYLLAGTRSDSPEGVYDNREVNDIFLVKTDSNGDTLWTKTLGGPEHDAVGESSNTMQQTSDNGYIIVGSTKSVESGDIDVWLIKISPEATIVSEKNYFYPSSFALYQNYPNPFNSFTKISYSVKESGPVKLNIYDISGSIVRLLVNEEKLSGNHIAVWDGRNEQGKSVASGIYYYTLTVGETTLNSKRMILLK